MNRGSPFSRKVSKDSAANAYNADTTIDGGFHSAQFRYHSAADEARTQQLIRCIRAIDDHTFSVPYAFDVGQEHQLTALQCDSNCRSGFITVHVQQRIVP